MTRKGILVVAKLGYKGEWHDDAENASRGDQRS